MICRIACVFWVSFLVVPACGGASSSSDGSTDSDTTGTTSETTGTTSDTTSAGDTGSTTSDTASSSSTSSEESTGDVACSDTSECPPDQICLDERCTDALPGQYDLTLTLVDSTTVAWDGADDELGDFWCQILVDGQVFYECTPTHFDTQANEPVAWEVPAPLNLFPDTQFWVRFLDYDTPDVSETVADFCWRPSGEQGPPCSAVPPDVLHRGSVELSRAAEGFPDSGLMHATLAFVPR